jgi:hypothetical protein
MVHAGHAQPWKNPLMIAKSADGVVFSTPAIFQDSSGVPSLIRWHGDTVIAAFQWFRQPNPSPSWDRVAVKFSYDGGSTWTQPAPITLGGLPTSYQRPFDPTLVRLSNDSIRLFFSSSNGMPVGTDSIINTYSAKSNDGIHYIFEPGARVDVDTNRVIDPAVINFNGLWHYLAPAGAPQEGAFHYISSDGFNFTTVPKILSDATHNWTGNYMAESSTELRFYGSGPGNVWYNSSPNGGVWNGYVNTNIQGGDPGVLKISAGNYLMIYTGPPYALGIRSSSPSSLSIRPNPASQCISIVGASECLSFAIMDVLGHRMSSGTLSVPTTVVDVAALNPGIYFLQVAAYAQSLSFQKY